ncbi:MAG: 4Fe-4S binding protein [Turicibacter sp.]|nr:4Fe-4S binding protein [Turicibacter sp.]
MSEVRQVRIAMRNCGIIDPANIMEYISRDGYMALGKVLFEMKPAEVVETVKASGLRGRGGGGFPTGMKWDFTAKSQGDKKYVICNADEGDPGAFMDRSILEGDPHSVLESMAICGYAIGANEGVIYIRAEYPKAVKRLYQAIEVAEEKGLLGENIMGSGFSFKISLYLGAGAFVCGEETALMNSIQGGRGEPRIKPPFPAQRGLWDCPTNVNNVETFANINPIILHGADWFRGFGNEDSPGTKVFALAGKVNNVGLIEIPMGMSLRDVIYTIGGGISDDKQFKAAQTGGPSGGCIPAQFLDTPVDFKSLAALGSIMGSGGLIVMDEDDCMVGISRFFLEFTAEESCGKCTPCRVGNMRLLETLTAITEGKGKEEDLDKLETLSQVIKDTALCGLGQSSPNPVLSTIKYYRDEYLAHVKDHKCPAGTCTALAEYKILADKCTGCTLCKRVCPVDCIAGETKKVHTISQPECIKCGACQDKCPFKAIVKE